MPTNNPTTTTGRSGSVPIESLPDPLKPIRPAPRNVNAPKPDEPPATVRRTADEVAIARKQAPATEDVTFSRGPARRPLVTIADPLLQWASGLPTSDRRIYAGWLVEARKDEALDQAMNAAGFSLVTIKHGSGNLVTHWAVEAASVFVVADGVQTIAEMKQTSDRYGIAFGWRRLPDGRMQSQLRCRVLLRELLAVGYEQPLLLTVKGTSTGDLLHALIRQYEVLDACAAFRAEAGKPAQDLPLYAFSIPLGPGQEVTRGTGNATKEIAPIASLVPEPVTKEHVKAHWVKRGWVGAIEQLVDETVAWSVSESAAIAEGTDERPGWEGNGDA